MGMTWTDDQKKVIETRKENILVAAAAGSGKTAVLVERIMSLILDEKDPADVDDLLVVTFTRAAAEEMRERIRRALEEARKRRPKDAHLMKQLTLIHTASIMTIDSFCMQVIRNNYEEADLDPSFRVGEDGELSLMRQDVLGELLEDFYKEGDADFFSFTGCYAPGRNDEALERMILGLYEFAQSYPWPDEWLKSCLDAYGPGDGEREPQWLIWLEESLKGSIRSFQEAALAAVQEALGPEGPYMYEEALREDICFFEEAQRAENFVQLSEWIASYAPAALSRKKDAAVSEEKRASVKARRDGYKKELERLKKRYFFQDTREYGTYMKKCRKPAQVLIRLTQEFARRFRDKKREKNLVDFSDLEHDCLNMFLKEEDGRRVVTDTARAYAGRYREIFIDEYQDSNLVQEILLNSIAGKGTGERNLFMVGDVKQSIYSFRLARPALFLEKYHTYRLLEEDQKERKQERLFSDGRDAGEEGAEGMPGKKPQTSPGVRIDLRQNFRSRREVLEGVNGIFREAMQEDLGGIAYDDANALYPGAKFPREGDEAYACEMLLLENPKDSGEQERTARELEAAMIAARIRELMQSMQVTDKNSQKLRPIGYGDIVILLRAMEGWADVYQEVLSAQGIPCRSSSRSGYFSSYEVQTVLNMLRVIDNPLQDIPLAAVLRSPIGGMQEEELAYIRSTFPQLPYCRACRAYAEKGPDGTARDKISAFYRLVDTYREKVTYMPIHQLLWDLLDETGFGAYVSAMQGGPVRRANLDMLVDKAIVFESTSYKGVFHFVRYIDRMMKYHIDFGNADEGTAVQDSVEILSIHKSKGLEYPVVIVSGLGKRFNETDARNPVVLHMDWGLGIDYVDEEKRVRIPTLFRRTIQRRMREEMLGEELRVLYVAMTRAKEKLILTGTVRDAQGSMRKWNQMQMSFADRFGASTGLDFLMPSICRRTEDGNGSFRLHLTTAEELVWTEVKEQAMGGAWAKRLRETMVGERKKKPSSLDMMLGYEYPWEGRIPLPVKLTVSELKRQQKKLEDELAEKLYPEPVLDPVVPRFITGEQPAEHGAARGDAYHRLLEHIDFGRIRQAEGGKLSTGVYVYLEELVQEGILSEGERRLIYVPDICRLLECPLGRRMQQAQEEGGLFREQPFVLEVPAAGLEIWEKEEGERAAGQQDDTVLIQGIMDAFFYEGGEIVLLDYKTDRVSSPDSLIKRYGLQLRYYQRALEQITGNRVKEAYIYSFAFGEAIPVPL